MDNDVAIACPIGRMQYVSDFDQAAANRAEIKKMEKYIVDLENERKTYFRRSQADKKKKIEAGKACFQIYPERPLVTQLYIGAIHGVENA